MRALVLCFFFLLTTLCLGQVNLTYQKPDQSIINLAEAPLAPRISMDRNGENIIFLYKSNYKTIEELSEAEMRLGGLRINPVTNIGSRTTFYSDLKMRKATPKILKAYQRTAVLPMYLGRPIKIMPRLPTPPKKVLNYGTLTLILLKPKN